MNMVYFPPSEFFVFNLPPNTGGKALSKRFLTVPGYCFSRSALLYGNGLEQENHLCKRSFWGLHPGGGCRCTPTPRRDYHGTQKNRCRYI